MGTVVPAALSNSLRTRSLTVMCGSCRKKGSVASEEPLDESGDVVTEDDVRLDVATAVPGEERLSQGVFGCCC